jgi:hypothetical protein
MLMQLNCVDQSYFICHYMLQLSMFLFSIHVDSVVGLTANSAVFKITENAKDSVLTAK